MILFPKQTTINENDIQRMLFYVVLQFILNILIK